MVAILSSLHIGDLGSFLGLHNCKKKGHSHCGCSSIHHPPSLKDTDQPQALTLHGWLPDGEKPSGTLLLVLHLPQIRCGAEELLILGSGSEVNTEGKHHF